MGYEEYKILHAINCPCHKDHLKDPRLSPKVKSAINDDVDYAVGQAIPIGEIVFFDSEIHGHALKKHLERKNIRKRMGYDDEAPEITDETTLDDLAGYTKKELVAIILASDAEIEEDEKELAKLNKADLIDFIADTYDIGSKIEGSEA